jgi:TIR domain-containing protein
VTAKPRTKKEHLVFISHSSKDRWIAKQMAKEIEARGSKHGVTTFLDEKDIDGGDPIPEAIREHLKACSEFVVLMSRYSVSRTWVAAEIGGAWVLEKRITPIIDKVPPDEMPNVIANYRAYDLNRFDEYLTEMVDRARKAGKSK